MPCRPSPFCRPRCLPCKKFYPPGGPYLNSRCHPTCGPWFAMCEPCLPCGLRIPCCYGPGAPYGRIEFYDR
uniref:Uncharacterized protein n=1 Tax=Culex tarsalis TaxID=7177 RepID=A0A1Q3FTP3_CULTA